MVNKLYVLVRGDLSKSQQAVQATHAVAEFMLYDNRIPCRCGQCEDQLLWKNETIVLLKVRNLEQLQEWSSKIKSTTNSYNEFYEPDIGNQQTAIAAWGLTLESLLKSLPLV
jgi:peptidyl-tRNA hydrolase